MKHTSFKGEATFGAGNSNSGDDEIEAKEADKGGTDMARETGEADTTEAEVEVEVDPDVEISTEVGDCFVVDDGNGGTRNACIGDTWPCGLDSDGNQQEVMSFTASGLPVCGTPFDISETQAGEAATQILTTEEIAAGMAAWKSEFIAQLEEPTPDPELLDATKIAAECPVFGNLVPNVYIEKVAIDATPGVKIFLKMIDQRNELGLYSIIGNELLEEYLKVVCVLSDDTSLSNSIKAIFNAGIYRESWFDWTTEHVIEATGPGDLGNKWGIPDALRYDPPGESEATRISGMPFSRSIYASEFAVDASDSFKITLLKDFNFDLSPTLQAQSEGTQNSELDATWETLNFPYLACFFYAQLDTQKIAEELGADIPEQFQLLSSEYFHEIIIGDAHDAPQLESYSTIGNTTKVNDHVHTYNIDDRGNGKTDDLSGQVAIPGVANHSHIVSNFKVSYVDGHIHEIDKMLFPVDNVDDYRTEALAAEAAEAVIAELTDASSAGLTEAAEEEFAAEELAAEEARIEEEREAQETAELAEKQAAEITACEAALELEQADAVEEALAELAKEIEKGEEKPMTNSEMQDYATKISDAIYEEQVAAGRWKACANMFSNGGTNGTNNISRNGATRIGRNGMAARSDSFPPNPLPDAGVFSDMFITKDSNGASRFLFFYDEGKDVQISSKNSSIMANMSEPAKNRIIRKKRSESGAGFTNFKITRCQVDESVTTFNALGSPVKRIALDADNEIKECVIESYKDIAEVVLLLPGQASTQGSKSEIRIFTGVDTSLSNTTAGTFQYDIEMEVKDGSDDVLDDGASSLKEAASLLNNYLSMAQQPGYFNETRGKFRVTGFYNEAVLDNVVDTYLDGAELIYDVSPSTRITTKAQFTKLLSSERGTIEGIETVQKALTDLISNIEGTTKQVHTPGSVSDTRATPKTDKRVSSTAVPLKTTNSFSSLVKKDFINDTYVDYFSGQTPNRDIGGLNVYSNIASNMRIVSKTGDANGGGSKTTISTEIPSPNTTEICGLSIRTAEASNTTSLNDDWFKKSTQAKSTTTMQRGASSYLGSGEGASGQMLQVSGSIKTVNRETKSKAIQMAQAEEILTNFAVKTMEAKPSIIQMQALRAGSVTDIPVSQTEYIEYLSGFELSTPSPTSDAAQLPPSDRQMLLKEPIWVKIPVSDVVEFDATMPRNSYLLMRRESQDTMDVANQYFLYSPATAVSSGGRRSRATTPTTTTDAQKLERRKASRRRQGEQQYVSQDRDRQAQAAQTTQRQIQINVDRGTVLSRKLAEAIKGY